MCVYVCGSVFVCVLDEKRGGIMQWKSCPCLFFLSPPARSIQLSFSHSTFLSVSVIVFLPPHLPPNHAKQCVQWAQDDNPHSHPVSVGVVAASTPPSFPPAELKAVMPPGRTLRVFLC